MLDPVSGVSYIVNNGTYPQGAQDLLEKTNELEIKMGYNKY